MLAVSTTLQRSFSDNKELYRNFEFAMQCILCQKVDMSGPRLRKDPL